MKKTILFLMFISAMISLDLSAQAVSGGSRLNMAGQKKAAQTGQVKFSGLASGMSYKPLSLQNPGVLNNFYRSILFSTPAPESTGVNTSEVVEKTSERRNISPEGQVRADEQLYANEKISVSNIYPNPASEFADVDYNIMSNVRDAKLIIYNVLGSQMAELPLNKSGRKLRVNTKDMPTGLYFYQLSLDGQKVATKKMLVRHQQ
ncbi:T9SS type A sorting domain-containing protein [Dyadobacter sandarakinus]|uniref:T9SS type A sorting domain-containing protein n=1 Tax=Dyadobacter sandarakinus TaxID=2747268 RepID=A0ABX7I8R1_9BACT|nr:T9SS type A sorting domain-containing protein [Dyadobacter sandarakinus]QRR01563.1 T9SS type A sorting domain-containing protein [Dyadobacter sandarakinus]